MAAKPREAPPWIQLEALERRAQSGEDWPRLWLIRGDEPFFARRAYESLARGAKGRGAELCVYDGADPDFQLTTLLGDLATPSMFVERQLFVLRGVDSALRKAGKKLPPLLAALETLFERDDPDRTVCVFATAMRADHILAKRAAALSSPVLNSRKLWDSPPPWRPDPMQAELVQWLLAHAGRRKIPLTPADALELTRLVGNDPGGLDEELGRLEALGGSGRDAAGSPGSGGGARPAFRAAGSPFAVADALLAGSTKAALVGIEGLYRGGMAGRDGERVRDPAAIGALLIRAVAGGLRTTLAAASAMAQGASPEEAAAAAGANAPRAKQSLLERLRAMPDPRVWSGRLEQVAGLERRLKGAGGLGAGDWSQLALSFAVAARRQASGRKAASGRGPAGGRASRAVRR